MPMRSTCQPRCVAMLCTAVRGCHWAAGTSQSSSAQAGALLTSRPARATLGHQARRRWAGADVWEGWGVKVGHAGLLQGSRQQTLLLGAIVENPP